MGIRYTGVVGGGCHGRKTWELWLGVRQCRQEMAEAVAFPEPGGTFPTLPLDVSIGAVVLRGSVDCDLLVSVADVARATRVFANHVRCFSTCLGSIVEPIRVLAAAAASFFALDKTRLVEATLASAQRREFACSQLATNAKLTRKS